MRPWPNISEKTEKEKRNLLLGQVLALCAHANAEVPSWSKFFDFYFLGRWPARKRTKKTGHLSKKKSKETLTLPSHIIYLWPNAQISVLFVLLGVGPQSKLRWKCYHGSLLISSISLVRTSSKATKEKERMSGHEMKKKLKIVRDHARLRSFSFSELSANLPAAVTT